MAAADVLFSILVDFSKGFQLNRTTDLNSVNKPVADNLTNQLPPEILAESSVTFVFYCFDNLAGNVKTNFESAVPTLSGRLLDSNEATVVFATGVVSGGPDFNILTFTIPANTIPVGFSAGNFTRFTSDVVIASQKTSFFQDISIRSIQQFSPESTVSTSSIEVSTIVIAGITVAAPALPGERYVILDGSTGVSQLTLPPTPGFDGQTFNIICVNSDNTCTVDGNGSTINGLASITLLTEESARIFEFDGDWLLINPIVGVS